MLGIIGLFLIIIGFILLCGAIKNIDENKQADLE